MLKHAKIVKIFHLIGQVKINVMRFHHQNNKCYYIGNCNLQQCARVRILPFAQQLTIAKFFFKYHHEKKEDKVKTLFLPHLQV